MAAGRALPCEPAPALLTAPAWPAGIPETDRFGHHDVLSTVEGGWRNNVFHRIRAVFGYGV